MFINLDSLFIFLCGETGRHSIIIVDLYSIYKAIESGVQLNTGSNPVTGTDIKILKMFISTKLKKMEDLFKKLGEITKPEKQGGFFDLPKDTRCKDKSHEPPTHIYIPQGKGYRHVCPSCGKVTDLIPPQISF